MKELKRLFTRNTIHKRVFSSLLAVLLVISSVIHPINVVPAYATSNWLKVNYEKQAKDDIELYVQAESASFEPGETITLDLFVQNNSSEEYTNFGISFEDKKDAFAEANFILNDDCGDAYISDRGSVTNLYLAPGETKALQFEGTLYGGLDVLNRKEITFLCGGYDANENPVTTKTEFPFTVGLFNELSIDFTDGTELIPDEKNTLEITIGFNDIGYYYNTDVATDSNAKVATDSDADLATDSDAKVATDSDADEDYVFDLTNVTLDLETVGVKFQNVKLTDAIVDEVNGTITAEVSYKVDEDAEAGEYFGTVTANVKNGKKVYQAQTGFQFEVEEVTDSTFKKAGLFTAELDNFTVNVEVAKGAFDEKVELVVTELAEDSEEFKTAEEAMEASEREFDGMMALDICFINGDGEEVEPNEGYSVQVSIEMNAEVLPEGIDTESLMVHHIAETTTDDAEAEVELVVEDVADTADATAGIVEVKEVDEAPVVAAEFSVESFSTFTITWSGSNTYTVSLIDSNGNPIKDKEGIEISRNYDANQKEIVMSTSAPKIEGYSFKTAVRAQKDNPTEALNSSTTVYSIEYYSSKWRYRTRQYGNRDEIGSNYQIYMIYDSIIPLEDTIQGVDTSGLINIHVKNFKDGDTSKIYNSATEKYDDGAFNIGKHGDNAINKYTNGHGVYQGIVSNVLGKDDFPSVVNDNSSLAVFFTKDGTSDPDYVEANYLFQKDSKGYYHYDSDKNAAYLDGNNFVLYNKPHATSGYNAGTQPQFMPYHQMSNTKIDTGSYSYYPYIGENGGLVKANPGSTEANYFFGMEVSFDFIMPRNGQVAYKKADGTTAYEPMIFEFNGDDDVWVFIDDVLVLDLGGVHQRSGGKIDFSTGLVTVDEIAGKANTVTWPQNTTIKQMFSIAQTKASANGYIGKAWNETDASEVIWNNDIFADYSKHTLRFFYMERGAGGSNCRLKFNLQTIPDGSLRIEKQLTDSMSIHGNAKTYIENSVEYQFVVLDAITNKSYFEEGTEYKVYTGNTSEKRYLAANGIINLKANQYALFEDMLNYNKIENGSITEYRDYYIKEIMEESIQGQYDNILFTVNGNGGSVVPEDENGDPTDELENFSEYKTPNIHNNQSQYVVFSNKVDLDELSMLTIRKEIAPNSNIASTEMFEFEVKLGSSADENSLKSIPANTEYLVGDEKRYADKDGHITLAADETATLVNGILAGTYYQISEVIKTDDEGNPLYNATYDGDTDSITNATDGIVAADPENVMENGTVIGMSGSVTRGDVVSITVTNAKNDFFKKIPINKVAIGFDKAEEPYTFNFEVTPCTIDESGTFVTAENLKYIGSQIEVETTNATETVPGNLLIRGNVDSNNTLYYFAVTEKRDENNPYIVYDQTVYVVEVKVQDGSTTIERVAKDGTWLKKDSGIPPLVFTNQFDNTGDVVISKVVKGNMADVSKNFTFTIIVTDAEENPLNVFRSSEEATSNDTNTREFTLSHGETEIIENLPVGAVVSISENEDGYVANYIIGTADINANTDNKQTGNSTVVIVNNMGNSVLFINEKNAIIDTGISMDTLPYILIMLAVIGGIAFTIIRRRKEDDLD